VHFRSESEEQTIEIGRGLASTLPRSGVVLLIGNLGAGKTTLTKGIALGRAGVVPDEVTSPTFTLVHEYAPDFVHIDLYRLETEREVLSIGFEDILDREALVLIEWGERFPGLMPAQRVEIRIRADGDTREIDLLTCGV